MRTLLGTVGVLLLAAAAGGRDEPTPDFKMTVEELFQESLADPKAANKKYAGKWLELEGRVHDANKWTSAFGLTLFGPKEPPKGVLFVGVVCDVPEADRPKVWQLGGGQKVKVLGRVSLFEKNGTWLVGCRVTELEKCPTPRLTAAKLTADFAKDAAAAEKRLFKSRGEEVADVIVEGVVAKLAVVNLPTVTLRGANGAVVTGPLAKDEYEKLKVGDAIVLKGNFAGFDKGEKTVSLNSAFLLPAGEKKK